MADDTTQTEATATIEPETPSMSFLSDESMNEIYEQATADPEPSETESTAPEPETVKPDADGTETEATETTEQPTTETTEPAEQVKPPASWTAEAKEEFSKLSPVIQQEVLKRETDFNKKMESSAESRKFAEQFENVVAPYRAAIQAEGGDPIGAFKGYLNYAYILRSGTQEQKQALIQEISTRYGVTPITSDSDFDEFVDPQISGLQAKIQELENKLNGHENERLQSAQTSAAQVVEKFKSETDEKGNPKHPHFDSVRGSMSRLMESGLASTINDAYEQAIHLDPKIRESIQAEKAKAEEAKRVEELKKKSNEAKKAAGTNLSSKATVDSKSVGKLLDDKTMSDIYDEIQSRG